MRVLLASTIIAASIAAAPLAFAAENATGTVKSIDLKAHSITLQDGMQFQLPTNFSDPAVKAGQKVQISYDLKSGKNEASTVKIVR